MRQLQRCLLVVLCLAATGSAMSADYTTSRVISVNKSGGNAADSAADANGLVAVPASAWNNYSALGAKTGGVTWNGSSTVTLESNWSVDLTGSAEYYWIPDGIENILRCYIDDNASDHAKMIFTSVPFKKYDVYVYMAADGAASFSPVSTIIDDATTTYTCGEDGVAFEGTDAWGQSQQLKSAAGTNVIIIRNQTAKDITIDGGTRGTTRGAIAAVQLVEVSAGEPVLWGNAGTTEEPGVATSVNGGGYTTFTVNFDATDNISQAGIQGGGTVSISKIRLFRRINNTGAAPATITISQEGAEDVVSKSVTLVADQKVYGPNWPEQEKNFWDTAAFEAVFDSDTLFDTSKPITLTFPSAQLLVMQPANSVMRTSNGWSPAIEITGIYTASDVNYKATIGGDKKFSEIATWEPARPTAFADTDIVEIANTAEATLTMDENVAMQSLRFKNAEGHPLTLVLSASLDNVKELDFTAAEGGVTFDVSGVAGDELVKNTAAGVSYSHWIYSGKIRGTCDFTLPDVPDGYEVKPEIVSGYGLRLVFLAPKGAKFGSVNINFAGGTGGNTFNDNAKVASLTTVLGGHPVIGTSWNDLEAKNQTNTKFSTYVASDGTVRSDGTMTLTASQVNNPYASGAGANMLITGYCDDGGSPIISIANIPFAKYRVIVYRATDTGGTTFSAVQIGTSAADVKVYYGPAKNNTDVRYTVSGLVETDWGKSDKRDGYYEGVNYVVSDVLEGSAGSATAYIYSNKHAGRAGVAAIQIVEVGKVSAYYDYTVSINDLGKFRIPAGIPVDKIRLYDSAGNPVTITGSDATYLYYEWNIKGGVCWWDYEFEGNGNNSGSEGTALSWDNGRPFKGSEYVTAPTGEQSLHIPTRPWRNVTSWPEQATFVMYGTMVVDDNKYYIVFGSTTGGTKNTVFLATDDVSSDTVVLCSANGLGANSTVTKLCTMTVPNAQSAKHLYAFVLKKDGENSVIDIYLDGELLQPYTFDGEFVLGPGFQIASPHGGEVTGYARPADDDPALLDWLRVYDVELTQETMTEYAKKYPYVPPNGSFQRNVSGDGLWDEKDAWTKEGSSPEQVNVPVGGSDVKIAVNGKSRLTVNLAADTTYEAIRISGTGAFAIDRDAGHVGKVRSSGRVTVETDATFAYDAFGMTGAPLTVNDNCSVTFDLSTFDFGAIWSSKTYELTGLVTTGENATVTCKYDGELPVGRSLSWGIDPVDRHFKFHVTMSHTPVAKMSGDTTFDALVWKVGETVVTPDWAGTVCGTVSNLVEGATLTFSQNLASQDSVLAFAGDKSLTLATGTDVAVTGVAYDFTGLDAKGTFAYDPTPAVVKGGHVRYDLDMGLRNYDEVMGGASGVYEFRKVVLNGAGDADFTVRVPEGDEVVTTNATAQLHCETSFDVCGGTLYLGAVDSAAIWYGVGGTRFNMSAGTTVVRANGQGTTGNGNGLLLGFQNGAPTEFNVTGGLLDVSGSSINFWEATATNNLSGGTIRAKGVFKGSKAGVINLSGTGVFEIGSLGIAADSCAFNLNGGELRGYEAGVVIANPIVQNGDAKIGSTDEADLTVTGGVTGSGAIGIPSGTVKLGKASALGTGAVTVEDGATLDLNGFVPGNAITISGVGARDAGALANTGGDVTYLGTLVLADDATVGGSGRLAYNQDSSIDLNGHTLSIAGDGVTLVLGGFTVRGGGAIAVTRGTLASNGSTKLGEDWECDLTIGANGALDLTHGSAISCRNFSSAGTVSGEGATLIVHGTFDASRVTSVPKLKLYDGATLNGVGLEVTTTSLTLGARLQITVPPEKLVDTIRIATIPEEAVIPVDETTVTVNGLEGYYLEQQGASLVVTSGAGNYAEVTLSSATGWTNFESIRVEGTIANLSVISPGTTNIDITVTCEDGTVTTRRFVYTRSPDWTFSYVVDGVKPGMRYSASAHVLLGSARISDDSKSVAAMTARSMDQAWIDEDSSTFSKKRSGTGDWLNTDGLTSVSGGNIVYTSKANRHLQFISTGSDTFLAVGGLKEVRIQETFTGAAFGTDGTAPDLTEGLVAIAIATDFKGLCQFAVATDGQWQLVDRVTFKPEFGIAYEIVIRIDERARTIAYGVVQDDAIVWLAEGAYNPQQGKTGYLQIAFMGAGKITKMDGTCHDANLFRQYGVAGREYADLDDALKALADEADVVLEPIWRVDYRLHEFSGSFCCVTNDLLTVSKDKWYRLAVSTNAVGDRVTYRYCASNNWIDYSDASGVTPMEGGGWLVANEVGLAWIAEQATSEVLTGALALDADLDLSSRNWTPIARFTGTFDGRGHTLVGLNNTNVVDNVVLGDAGHYFGGTTNDWGHTAYGLFGCATNAVFRDVTLSDVAISNAADSVAALLGVHAGGDLEIVRVVVTNGFVRGEGGAVAGLVTVGGNGGGTIGSVIVTNNANYATIGGSVACDEAGGNVAQVLAGTTLGTGYLGDVVATNNVGAGAFDVAMSSDLAWLGLPVCNLAHAVVYTDANYDFWHFIEANDPCSIVVDPVNLTARMSADRFENGDANIAGWWVDTISAVADGAMVTLKGTDNTYDVWNAVNVDRDITFDINGNCLYGVYDCDVFTVAAGKTLTLKNGAVYYAEGYQPAGGPGRAELAADVKTAQIAGDFYQRTVPLSGLSVEAGYVTIDIPFTSLDFEYVVDSTTALAAKWTEVGRAAGTGGRLPIQVPTAGESGFYRVRIVVPEYH